LQGYGPVLVKTALVLYSPSTSTARGRCGKSAAKPMAGERQICRVLSEAINTVFG